MKRTKEYRDYLAEVRRTGYLDHPNQKQVAEWIADDKRREEIFGAREAFLATLPEPPNVEVGPKGSTRTELVSPSNSNPFQRHLAALKHGHLWAQGVAREQIQRWEADPKHRKLIDQAKAEWKQRLDRIQSIKSRDLKPGDKAPDPLPADDDPNTLAFNAKILPNLEKDVESGSLYTEGTIAAMNLPGWADAIARYARAANDPKHKATVIRFFVELGKALRSGRTLWDAKDELIFCNYFSTKKFEKPLCQMSEQEGSELVGLTVDAYDKRLQRFGLKRKGGRPRKQDKTLRRRS